MNCVYKRHFKLCIAILLIWVSPIILSAEYGMEEVEKCAQAYFKANLKIYHGVSNCASLVDKTKRKRCDFEQYINLSQEAKHELYVCTHQEDAPGEEYTEFGKHSVCRAIELARKYYATHSNDPIAKETLEAMTIGSRAHRTCRRRRRIIRTTRLMPPTYETRPHYKVPIRHHEPPHRRD